MIAMRTKKVSGLPVTVNKGDTYVPETPENCPSGRQVSIFCGRRNSGKTTACASLIEKMGYDRLFLVSPTALSNQGMVARLKIAPEDIYDPNEPGVLRLIIDEVERERDDYERYVEEMKRWKQFVRQLKRDDPVFSIPDEVLLSFFKDGEFKKPYHKYGGRKPFIGVAFDDCLGSRLFTKDIRLLNATVILHRHVAAFNNEPGAIGLDMYFLTQSWKSNVGTLPPVIRNQCTTLLVFKTKSEKELQSIQEEIGGEVDKETFYRIYEYCTQGRHDFMFIDMFPKEGLHPSPYRKNLDEFVIPENFSGTDTT